MEKVTVYTMKNCTYCSAIKEKLQKNNIEFTEKVTNEWPEEWNEIVDLINMPTTPTIYYKENYFVPNRDFGSPENLVNILRNFQKPRLSESRQALEKVKTLNYNIATAFSRLDQLVKNIEQKINKQ